MTAYTNVEIPELYSIKDRLREQIQELELKNKILSDKVFSLHNILKNIPEAVQEYGYVEITYEDIKMKLIEKRGDDEV